MRRLVVVWYGERHWAGYVLKMLVDMVLGVGIVFELELNSGTKVDRVWLRVASCIDSWG